MIPDESVDFVFSFDSLVHAEDDVIASYISQLERKLTKNGVGFIHHSNLGEYTVYRFLHERLWRWHKALAKLGILEHSLHWRAWSVTATKFSKYADIAGLRCIGQEKVNWGTKRLIDCMSTFTKDISCWLRPNVVVRNRDFMLEARRARYLTSLYSAVNYPNAGTHS
jgi:hypothetical protein